MISHDYSTMFTNENHVDNSLSRREFRLRRPNVRHTDKGLPIQGLTRLVTKVRKQAIGIFTRPQSLDFWLHNISIQLAQLVRELNWGLWACGVMPATAPGNRSKKKDHQQPDALLPAGWCGKVRKTHRKRAHSEVKCESLLPYHNNYCSRAWPIYSLMSDNCG